MQHKLRFIRYIAGILLIVTLWSFAAVLAYRGMGSYFPSPLSAAGELIDLLLGKEIYGSHILSHTAASLARWFSAFALALAAGIALGIAIGYANALFELCMPLVTFLQIIPGLAWIPIAMLLFGLGERATFFMIFITSLSPIIVNTSGGIREIPQVYLRASRMMGLGRSTFFFRILIPAASLSIVNGMRIALASGWRVLIAAEMVVGSSRGLGYLIIQSRWSLDFVSSFAVIIIIVCIGLLAEKVLFQILETKLRRRMGYEAVR